MTAIIIFMINLCFAARHRCEDDEKSEQNRPRNAFRNVHTRFGIRTHGQTIFVGKRLGAAHCVRSDGVEQSQIELRFVCGIFNRQ